MSTFSSVEQQAMQLSPEERERLAFKLADSPSDFGLTDVEKSWLPIIEERHQEILSGRVKPIPMDLALDNIQRELGTTIR